LIGGVIYKRSFAPLEHPGEISAEREAAYIRLRLTITSRVDS
jgi:hypothetical protein